MEVSMYQTFIKLTFDAYGSLSWTVSMVRVQPYPSTLKSACKVKTATLDMLEGAGTEQPSVSKVATIYTRPATFH
jgi:hypothetical protein